MFRDEKFVMAHQQHQLSTLQRLLPSAKRVPGGVTGRVSMTLQDGATTSDILTGILQVCTSSATAVGLMLIVEPLSCLACVLPWDFNQIHMAGNRFHGSRHTFWRLNKVIFSVVPPSLVTGDCSFCLHSLLLLCF